MEKEAPLLSVIIAAYNCGTTLDRCLTALFESEFQSFEVIVVDDGSTDDSAGIAAHYPCQVLRLPHNQGPGAARNAAASQARGAWLFFLDADILVNCASLGEIAASIAARPDMSALFCSFQKDTVPQNFFSQYKNLIHHYTHQTADEVAATFCGGFGAIRREVFQAAGGFDHRFRVMEDVELGYRLHRAGYCIWLNKRIQLTHCKVYTLLGLIRSDLFGRAIPWTRIMLAKRMARNDLNTRWHNVFSVPVAFALLAGLPVAVWSPAATWGLIAVLLLFLWLNRGFLCFVHHEKGAAFACRTVAMMWVTYLYSGLGLGIGTLGHLLAVGRRHWCGRTIKP